MIQKEFVIHRADINNHCPNCFSARGMVFSFTQRQKENSWIVLTSSNINGQLFCQHCHQEVYPGTWSDAIERVYLYQKKCFTAKPHGLKLKKKAKIALGLVILSIVLFLGAWIMIKMAPYSLSQIS